MVASHGSIPGYKPGPVLSGPKKVFISSLVIIPAVAYFYIRKRQNDDIRDRRLLEEAGRRSWSQGDGNQGKDMSVVVGRSGGGI